MPSWTWEVCHTDLYTLLKMTFHDGGSYLLKNFKTNQQKWQELQSKMDNTNLSYAMKFSLPTREG
jgi:hypothetical protein